MTLKIEGLPLAQLQKRKSQKWRDYGEGVLPLPVAEMDFEIAAQVREALIKMLQVSDTGYLGSIPELNASFAKFAKTRWGWDIKNAQFYTAADVGVAIVEFCRTFLNPGDGIILNTPVYHNFMNWINELKATPIDVPLKKSGMEYSLDFAALETAYKNGAKAHFLCSPHNPVGVVFTKAELTKLAELAKKYNVIILSDEIHAPLTYSESKFVPFLDSCELAKEVGICITAASKSWNLAGLKCAFLITESEEMDTLAKKMPAAVHYRASLFGAVGATVAFTAVDWLDATLETLDRNRKFVKMQIDTKLPTVGYRIPNCSYLAWLDLSSLQLGENPAQTLLDKEKVAFSHGITYGPQSGQFIRLNFGTSEEIISEAIDRIARACK
jgi:cysteine-S-conjugate beta-lyase